MIISLAMAETNGIYGLVVALLLLFANPLVTRFVDIIASGVLG
jgi:F-type H+-transporting ATPase subunit c